MQPPPDHEDTLQRARIPSTRDADPAPDLESTIAVRRSRTATSPAPIGARLSAPPPPSTLAPPQGPALSSLDRVRIGHETVVLAVPVRIGRNPGRPRIPTAMVRMRVPSPELGISADHLEIRQTGSAIVIRDLDSTNGSLGHLPGRAPRRLARGESMAVPMGTVLDLGEGVEVEVLGPAASPGDPAGTSA
ncbi:MAG: FHA domain-containing protein [Micrococcales bacterium]|nr:FHA domain-containing protein [Micrococcales bacterium]